MISTCSGPRCRRPASLAVLASASVLFGMPAYAAPPAEEAICDAIRDLGYAAIASGTPQRIGFGRVGPRQGSCGPVDIPVHEDFCKVLVDKVGLSSPQRFPWMVYDCLGVSHGIPTIETTDEYSGVSGRKKIVHLTASLKEGFGLDIRFVPTGDFGSTPYYKNYFGTYAVTIWKL